MTKNVLPTATLDLRYNNHKLTTRAFFDTGSQRSFVSLEIKCRLNLPVIQQVPIQLSTFENDSTSCLLALVRVKVQFGKRRIPIKLLVHDQASMELNCPGIYDVTQQLESQGHQLAYRFITLDVLTGIGVNYFSCFITQQKRPQGTNMFVTRGWRVIPFGPLPKWVTNQQSSNNQF